MSLTFLPLDSSERRLLRDIYLLDIFLCSPAPHPRPIQAPSQSSPKRPQAEEETAADTEQKIHVPLAYRRTQERIGWSAYALKTLASFGIDGGKSPGG